MELGITVTFPEGVPLGITGAFQAGGDVARICGKVLPVLFGLDSARALVILLLSTTS
jgi:hypothetical protein